MNPRIRGIAGPQDGKEYSLGKTPLNIGRGARNHKTLKVLRNGASNYADKAVCFPMTAVDTRVGVIFAGMTQAGAEWFTAAHIEVFESIAASTAIALEHQRVIGTLFLRRGPLSYMQFAPQLFLASSSS